MKSSKLKHKTASPQSLRPERRRKKTSVPDPFGPESYEDFRRRCASCGKTTTRVWRVVRSIRDTDFYSGQPIRMTLNEQPPILVDTNIVSYIYEASELGLRYDLLLERYSRFGSPVTLAELHYGAYWRNWGANRWQRLNEVLGQLQWLPLTVEVARLASHLAAKRRHGGSPVKWADTYIAATALINGLPS